MRRKVLFACPGHKKLAEELTADGSSINLGKIQWGKFSDGFPNLKILDAESLIDNDVIFLADFPSGEEIFRQMAIISALPSYGINSLKVFLPFFSTGTMDRVIEEGQIVTAKTLARMLSAIPSAACPAQIIIFDIHALQEVFYFSDKVRVRHISGINLLLNLLEEEGKTRKNLVIAFPDEGAYKRFNSYFKNYDKIICEKRRENGKRIINIKEGNPKGKEILIVDDLILSGGTLLESAKVLMDNGALKISAYATHGVFPKKNWQTFFDNDINLYLSNSCPVTVNKIKDKSGNKDSLKVISLGMAIMKEIYSMTQN